MSTVYVTTAIALDDSLRQAVQQMVTKKFRLKEPDFKEIVDPDVIGGIKLTISGHVYDATVAHKLQQLQNA
jgi:F-type H+-transporting ATPase subunit delta